MSISFVQILLILVVVLVLFGAGKLPGVMGDLGKGMRNFKDGLKEGEEDKNEEPPKPTLPDKSKVE
ncbi:MAG: twin-arginine translocase TatA/TatE family subunit [Alphaproteobacteria bacterium]|nr:twin-arginine translocase TatA/TatE family subunit [Alphaproteobacteria bacterium]